MAKFVVYEKVAEAVYKRVDKSTTSDLMQTGINLGSGLIAGFAAAIVSQPADTMLSKIEGTWTSGKLYWYRCTFVPCRIDHRGTIFHIW